MQTPKDGAVAGANPAKPKVSTAKIDALIAAAQNRNKRSLAETSPETAKKLADAKEQGKVAEAARANAKTLREAARTDRKAQREKDAAERAERRAAKKAEVEGKRAKRDAERLEKAAAKGKKAPELAGEAKDAFDRIASLALGDIAQVYAALGTLVKSRSIGAVGKIAEADRPEPGDHVRITGGEHAGKTGHVSKAQRIRCFVDLEGMPEGKKKSVYLYISQVEVLPDSTAKKAAKPAPEQPATQPEPVVAVESTTPPTSETVGQ